MPPNAPHRAPFLSELRDGDTFFDATWRVSLPEHRPYKQRENGFFVVCTVADNTGSREVRCFDKPALELSVLQGATFIRCDGKVGVGQYRGQISLENLQIIEPPEDLSRFEMPMCGDFRAHQARFNDLIRGVRDPHFRALLKEIFRHEGEFWSRFAHAPAATNNHHAYRGGLLEHSGEVALLCERLAGALPHIDRDLLITAALLHDIGKIEEMECDFSSGKIEYTHAGRLVGHIVLGSCIVASAAEKIEGFPPRLKHELMHLILSHHGEPEYGAAKRPMCAEALILSQCDNLSAKIAMCAEKAEGEGDFASTGGWHNLPFAPQKLVYVGKMR
ncbi:MAG: HD domain-containing protein, partial [Armatimonadetes bacterium]|nr:HD domain-containing protein [Armatimonadota bacterium]